MVYRHLPWMLEGAGAVADGVALGGPARRRYSARWLDLIVSAHRWNNSVCDFLEDRLFPSSYSPSVSGVM